MSEFLLFCSVCQGITLLDDCFLLIWEVRVFAQSHCLLIMRAVTVLSLRTLLQLEMYAREKSSKIWLLDNDSCWIKKLFFSKSLLGRVVRYPRMGEFIGTFFV